jgi:hypothetical protein
MSVGYWVRLASRNRSWLDLLEIFLATPCLKFYVISPNCACGVRETLVAGSFEQVVHSSGSIRTTVKVVQLRFDKCHTCEAKFGVVPNAWSGSGGVDYKISALMDFLYFFRGTQCP